jgi:hypothetical protein
MSGIGRPLLAAGAILLLGTAAIHAAGCRMVADWTEALGPQQRYGLQLVWLTDSLGWIIAAIVWLVAVRRPDRSWRHAAMLVAVIPLLTGGGIMLIDPAFFGGHLLLASGLLGITGAALADDGVKREEGRNAAAR